MPNNYKRQLAAGDADGNGHESILDVPGEGCIRLSFQEAKTEIPITLSANTMPLYNSGYDVFLIDAAEMIRHTITCSATQAQVGIVLVIP